MPVKSINLFSHAEMCILNNIVCYSPSIKYWEIWQLFNASACTYSSSLRKRSMCSYSCLAHSCCFRLPFAEHIFYDNSYKDRSPSQKFVKTLDKLEELGESVTDEQLKEAKERVKPDFVLQHFFTSVRTDLISQPLCSK